MYIHPGVDRLADFEYTPAYVMQLKATMKLVAVADIDMEAMLRQKQAHVRLDVRAITQARALGHDVNDFDAVNLFILSFEFRCVG